MIAGQTVAHFFVALNGEPIEAMSLPKRNAVCSLKVILQNSTLPAPEGCSDEPCIGINMIPSVEQRFNQGAFDDGYRCRLMDGDQWRDNPYASDPITAGGWMDQSFRAGYADAADDPDAPWNKR